MSKSKSASVAADITGLDTLKTGFEKAAKVFETTADFNRGNIEAYVESATIAGEGLRTINSEISLYSKKAIEKSVAATKAIMGSKSIHEAIELQTSFAKIAFGAYVGQMKMLNDLIVGTAKDALVPLQGRAEAFSQIAHSAVVA